MKGDDFSREEILETLDLEDVRPDSYGLNYAYRDYLTVHKHMFLQGMDKSKAKDAAKDMVRRDWGKNVDGKLMYLPPEKTGVPKPCSIRSQASQITRGYFRNCRWRYRKSTLTSRPMQMCACSRMRLLVDRGAFGRPVDYLVSYVKDDGIVEFVMEKVGENERLVRWIPTPDNASKAVAEGAIQAGARRARRKFPGQGFSTETP